MQQPTELNSRLKLSAEQQSVSSLPSLILSSGLVKATELVVPSSLARFFSRWLQTGYSSTAARLSTQ